MIGKIQIVVAKRILYPIGTLINEGPWILPPIRVSISGVMIGPSPRRVTVMLAGSAASKTEKQRKTEQAIVDRVFIVFKMPIDPLLKIKSV